LSLDSLKTEAVGLSGVMKKWKGVCRCYCKARLWRIQRELLCGKTKAVKCIDTTEAFAGQRRNTATNTTRQCRD